MGSLRAAIYLSVKANKRFLIQIALVHLIAVDRFSFHALSPFQWQLVRNRLGILS